MIKHERLNNSLKHLSEKLIKVWGYIRNNLITGVLALVPVAVTIYIIYFIFQFADSFLGSAIGESLGYNIPGMGIFLTALFCLLIGVIVNTVVGKRLITWIDNSLNQIPIVKSVYSGIKQVADVFVKNNKSNFKRVVMLEYPKENSWVIGFVTSDFTVKIDGDIPEKENMVTIFVPTTPNPTSGFLLILPKSKIIDMNIDIEDAMKIIISAGLVQPPGNNSLLSLPSGDKNLLENKSEEIVNLDAETTT